MSEPNEHRQMAFVERLNQTLGQRLWKIQVDQEIETGHPVRTWRRWYRGIIDDLNQKRLKKLDPKTLAIKDPPPQPSTPLFDGKPLLKVGKQVRLAINHPETVHGQHLTGTFRKTDPRYRYKVY